LSLKVKKPSNLNFTVARTGYNLKCNEIVIKASWLAYSEATVKRIRMETKIGFIIEEAAGNDI
jgi:hypothetical protein